MEMKNLSLLKGILFIFFALAFAACDDDSEPAGKGEVEFEITDAPADDANIKGVFVTVADVKVDGNSLEGFSRQTIDLKAYSEGNTKILGSGDFDARTYQNVVLVLDLQTDASGSSPGCYVLDQNNTRHQLKSTTSGTMEVAVNKSWTVVRDTKTSIVMDFDLRKAIRRSQEGASPYSFVSDNNLSAAVNLVAKAKAGTIKGTYDDNNNSSNADKIIVYAYKKGTFDAATETTPQGGDDILFAKAVSSAAVKQSIAGNEFTLAFLEEGEYELHFIGYSHDPQTGRYTFESRLQSETNIDGSAGNLITIKGGATVNVAATITGLL
jgi:hypothetical protein